ncbi:hypothetical protein BV25DRAFT_1838606 [Artomyces pyxidatus]|uniref:Uncharacterized protein n=1 Tax=Artomyces pyxidatus TaxID=48021 RepID=A0ACB8T036_9AGAM|nr:hypothetical protein BV25DRAFT_1838606 [Artomyces pyxidatus]
MALRPVALVVAFAPRWRGRVWWRTCRAMVVGNPRTAHFNPKFRSTSAIAGGRIARQRRPSGIEVMHVCISARAIGLLVVNGMPCTVDLSHTMVGRVALGGKPFREIQPARPSVSVVKPLANICHGYGQLPHNGAMCFTIAVILVTDGSSYRSYRIQLYVGDYSLDEINACARVHAPSGDVAKFARVEDMRCGAAERRLASVYRIRRSPITRDCTFGPRRNLGSREGDVATLPFFIRAIQERFLEERQTKSEDWSVVGARYRDRLEISGEPGIRRGLCRGPSAVSRWRVGAGNCRRSRHRLPRGRRYDHEATTRNRHAMRCGEGNTGCEARLKPGGPTPLFETDLSENIMRSATPRAVAAVTYHEDMFPNSLEQTSTPMCTQHASNKADGDTADRDGDEVGRILREMEGDDDCYKSANSLTLPDVSRIIMNTEQDIPYAIQPESPSSTAYVPRLPTIGTQSQDSICRYPSTDGIPLINYNPSFYRNSARCGYIGKYITNPYLEVNRKRKRSYPCYIDGRISCESYDSVYVAVLVSPPSRYNMPSYDSRSTITLFSNDETSHDIWGIGKRDSPYPDRNLLPTIYGPDSGYKVRWIETVIHGSEAWQYRFKLELHGGPGMQCSGVARNALVWGPARPFAYHMAAGDVWVCTGSPPSVSISLGEGIWVEWTGNDHANRISHPLLPERRLWFSFQYEFSWIKCTGLSSKRSMWRRNVHDSGEYMRRRGRVDRQGNPIQATVKDVVDIMALPAGERSPSKKTLTACNRCRHLKIKSKGLRDSDKTVLYGVAAVMAGVMIGTDEDEDACVEGLGACAAHL